MINFTKAKKALIKYIVPSLITVMSFGVLFQVSNVYVHISKNENNPSFVNFDHMFKAIKSSIPCILITLVLSVLALVNITNIYILQYSSFVTVVLLSLNFILLFELLLMNIFFPLFINEKGFRRYYQPIIMGNMNIGMSIIIIILVLVIVSCIFTAPTTSIFLYPALMVMLSYFNEQLFIKYTKLQQV